ncbi:hypothetical protein K1719_025540 [Acacia pycnantha]|nr:hypothetical protein K1719_025540 [Acacia pycnantha]
MCVCKCYAFYFDTKDAGAYLERKVAGLRNVRVGDTDFSQHSWGYQVGLVGEYLQVYTETGSSKVQWKKLGSSNPLTWYKTTFDAPPGNDPEILHRYGTIYLEETGNPLRISLDRVTWS